LGAASSVFSATEVARHGVTANVVVLGLVDTAMALDMTAAQREKLVEPIPMARLGTPEEVVHDPGTASRWMVELHKDALRCTGRSR
jgi:NAD(P)-dependent dehydrogenase (short-subunit alcohol dehydrogenase family)